MFMWKNNCASSNQDYPLKMHVKLDGLDAETTGDLGRIPSGWSVSCFHPDSDNEHTLYTFRVTASDNGSEGPYTCISHSHGNDYKRRSLT